MVLLKRGFIYVEECEKGQEFSTAETASAGILGVFENIEEARAMTCDGLPPGVAGQTVQNIRFMICYFCFSLLIPGSRYFNVSFEVVH